VIVVGRSMFDALDKILTCRSDVINPIPDAVLPEPSGSLTLFVAIPKPACPLALAVRKKADNR